MEEKVEEAISKRDVIVIGGPTASGKTGLSIELAKRINGQLYLQILCKYIKIWILEQLKLQKKKCRV